VILLPLTDPIDDTKKPPPIPGEWIGKPPASPKNDANENEDGALPAAPIAREVAIETTATPTSRLLRNDRRTNGAETKTTATTVETLGIQLQIHERSIPEEMIPVEEISAWLAHLHVA
jgi:hypothetical protein